MIGYIMKKRQMAMGIETTGASFTDIANPSRNRATPGANRPSNIPTAIHKITHIVK
jgi:hypothetical protein